MTAAPHPGDRATPCACGAPSVATLRPAGAIPTRICGACAGARLCADRPGACLLCGAPGTYVGIYRPDEPRLYGARHGGPRLLRYTLCCRCAARADRCERAEEALAAMTGGEGAA